MENLNDLEQVEGQTPYTTENLQEILEEEGSITVEQSTSQEETQVAVQEPFFYQPTPEEQVSYITSVKVQGNGWLVNGNMSVPDDDGNTHCRNVKLWLSLGNTPEPEFTEEELRTKFENEFRQNRDNLLNTVVDHYQKPLVWESLTTEQQDKVRVYRQSLLDSTNTWVLPEGLVI